MKKFIVMNIVGTMGDEEIVGTCIVKAETERDALRKYMKDDIETCPICQASPESDKVEKATVERSVKEAEEIEGGLRLGEGYGLFVAEVRKELE